MQSLPALRVQIPQVFLTRDASREAAQKDIADLKAKIARRDGELLHAWRRYFNFRGYGKVILADFAEAFRRNRNDSKPGLASPNFFHPIWLF